VCSLGHNGNGFKELWVFSISNYLRSLKDTPEIVLEMPSAARRIDWLKKIFRNPNE
jgi:hypothetical protein